MNALDECICYILSETNHQLFTRKSETYSAFLIVAGGLVGPYTVQARGNGINMNFHDLFALFFAAQLLHDSELSANKTL